MCLGPHASSVLSTAVRSDHFTEYSCSCNNRTPVGWEVGGLAYAKRRAKQRNNREREREAGKDTQTALNTDDKSNTTVGVHSCGVQFKPASTLSMKQCLCVMWASESSVTPSSPCCCLPLSLSPVSLCYGGGTVRMPYLGYHPPWVLAVRAFHSAKRQEGLGTLWFVTRFRPSRKHPLQRRASSVH